MFTPRPIVVSALACALLASAPAGPAAAQPADMRPSVARLAAEAQHKQDLRTEATRDSRASGGATADARKQDLRHLRAGGGAERRPLPGPPTWPVDPQPSAPSAAVHASDGGGGVDWTTVVLGIAGGLLAVAAVAGTVLHIRGVERARVTT